MEIPVFNANSVDPDQTPRCLASDLGPHCLSIPLLWDVWHKWVYNDCGIHQKDNTAHPRRLEHGWLVYRG